MKKLISLIAVVSMLFCTSAVMADKSNNSPDVFIGNTEILFDDQAPIIVEGRTLIPARGVFEALGCKVSWDGDRQLVTIESDRNIKRIFITIGSDQMRILTYKTILSSDESFVKLDVPAQIMNDRTMIPFRAISEALGHGVEWDHEAYAVLIKKAQSAAADEKKLALSLSTDAVDVKAGDEVVVNLNVENLDLYKGSFLSGIAASIEYDKNNFDFVKAYMCNENGENLGASGAENPDYTADSLKVMYLTINSNVAMKADGTVMKFVFTAKNDAKGTFALTDRYNTKVGYDATILVDDGTKSQTIQGDALAVDTTELAVTATAGTATPDEKVEDVVEDEFAGGDFVEEPATDTESSETEAPEGETAEDETTEDAEAGATEEEVVEDTTVEDAPVEE